MTKTAAVCQLCRAIAAERTPSRVLVNAPASRTPMVDGGTRGAFISPVSNR